ncbi:MAG: glycosyltransferase [Candidatus Levyibacteriota bacterium]
MKVAVVYDRVNKWGGAERVLLALHELFPEAPLYTSVYNSKTAPWAKVFPKVIFSFLQKFPFATRHELYVMLMPLAFEKFSAKGGFDEFDLVISVTSEAAKGIITKEGTFHLCYCLTPTRYLWSGYEEYFKNSLLRFLAKPAVFYLRRWDKIAAKRPDAYVAISKEVQKRIKKYYKRESTVIYPPLALLGAEVVLAGPAARQPHAFPTALTSAGPPRGAPRLASPAMDSPRHSYFLIVSRLVPYKRIDIAVEAFNELGLPLKIIGIGSQEAKLKRMAKRNIEFLGNLTDIELVSYYKNCRALIFPGIEDFGLTIIEAQSFGKPVIAFASGGAREIIVEGKTGEFFFPQTKAALVKKLKGFRDDKYKGEDCLNQANKFNKKIFKERILKFIKSKIK